jgi:hypothetical protein
MIRNDHPFPRSFPRENFEYWSSGISRNSNLTADGIGQRPILGGVAPANRLRLRAWALANRERQEQESKPVITKKCVGPALVAGPSRGERSSGHGPPTSGGPTGNGTFPAKPEPIRRRHRNQIRPLAESISGSLRPGLRKRPQETWRSSDERQRVEIAESTRCALVATFAISNVICGTPHEVFRASTLPRFRDAFGIPPPRQKKYAGRIDGFFPALRRFSCLGFYMR